MNVNNRAQIIAAFGGTGSGKSHFIKAALRQANPARLIVVDPDAEYAEFGQPYTSTEQLLRASTSPAFRLRFVPSHARSSAERQFAAVCAIVRWQLSPSPGQRPPPKPGGLVFVVDELADFVGASFRESPDAWQWLIRHGRKFGLVLYAASQRPAQIDKTLFDLATTIRTGRLNNIPSQRTLADALGVTSDQVQALTGYQYLERDKNTGKLRRG